MQREEEEKIMKKNLLKTLGLVTVITSLFIGGCGNAAQQSTQAPSNDAGVATTDEAENTVVTIAVVGEAQEMWTPVIEQLAEEGITVELQAFSDYHTPNEALANGEVDLTAHQHHAYLNSENGNYDYNLVAIGDTFISTMNIYSDNHASVDEIPEGGKIAVPNDPSNEGRALQVIAASGLITLSEDTGDTIDLADIVENTKNIEFVELEAANVASILPDVDAAVINCNYALDFGLNPGEDAIFKDNVNIYSDDKYFNIIAARAEDADNEVYNRIVEAYQSEDVIEVYQTAFKGAYLPTWN